MGLISICNVRIQYHIGSHDCRKLEQDKKQLELDKQLERENKRKEKQLQKLRSKELIDMSSKLRAEAKAVAQAQRKLESVRVLRALFERIEVFVAIAILFSHIFPLFEQILHIFYTSIPHHIASLIRNN